jgi:cyclic pyranopterin phosphate synthase
MQLLQSGDLKKGDAIAASRVAAIYAAKKTSDLIPLTHPIKLDSVRVDIFPIDEQRMGTFVTARATDRTGVEMEAMVGASAAMMNIYDMVKGIDKAARIESVRLIRKTGGKSGDWLSDNAQVGKIEKLATSKGKGTPKEPCDQAHLKVKFGLEGDAHGGDWHRQVSLLGLESINKMKDKGLNVDFGSFAENIATSGVCLYKLPIGTLMYGESGSIMQVTQIGKECHNKCAVYYQAGDCVMPREGIFTVVLVPGPVNSGDEFVTVTL